EEQRVDVEEGRDDHQRQEARHHEVLDRVDAEHRGGVGLLADLARAEVGGDGRAGNAGEDDRGHERRELAHAREDEEAAEAIERPEQDQEVARLQARRAVAERNRRYQEREPTQPQREEELDHELAAIRVRRPQRGHDGLASQDHHVADLLEQVLRWQERSVGYSANHADLLPGYCTTCISTTARADTPARACEEYAIARLAYNFEPSIATAASRRGDPVSCAAPWEDRPGQVVVPQF